MTRSRSCTRTSLSSARRARTSWRSTSCTSHLQVYFFRPCYLITIIPFIIGVKKISANPEDDEGEPEYKFEWQVSNKNLVNISFHKYIVFKSYHAFFYQRTWGHAPKESYLADGDQFAEQPFGIQVKILLNIWHPGENPFKIFGIR